MCICTHKKQNKKTIDCHQEGREATEIWTESEECKTVLAEVDAGHTPSGYQHSEFASEFGAGWCRFNFLN